MPLHFSQQLTHSEAKGIVTELWAPISPANARGVIDPDAQENGVRGLASQLSAAMPFLLPAMRHFLKTIATQLARAKQHERETKSKNPLQVSGHFAELSHALLDNRKLWAATMSFCKHWTSDTDALGVRNVMAAAWAMPLDFDPPKVLVVVDSRTLTRELIEGSGVFALNIPTRAIAETTLTVGTLSGRDVDKFDALGLVTMPARTIDVPLVAGCAGWLECRVIPEPHNEKRYDLFIAEVTAAWADPALFSNGRWHFTDAGSKTLHYLAGGAFFETGEAFTVEVKQL